MTDSDSMMNVFERTVQKYHPTAIASWLTWLRPALAVVHPGPMKDILKASHSSAPKSREYHLFLPWIGKLS